MTVEKIRALRKSTVSDLKWATPNQRRVSKAECRKALRNEIKRSAEKEIREEFSKEIGPHVGRKSPCHFWYGIYRAKADAREILMDAMGEQPFESPTYCAIVNAVWHLDGLDGHYAFRPRAPWEEGMLECECSKSTVFGPVFVSDRY